MCLWRAKCFCDKLVTRMRGKWGAGGGLQRKVGGGRWVLRCECIWDLAPTCTFTHCSRLEVGFTLWLYTGKQPMSVKNPHATMRVVGRAREIHVPGVTTPRLCRA